MSSFVYPNFKQIREVMGDEMPSFRSTGHYILFFAKLGLSSCCNLAFLFVAWNFQASQISFVFASASLISRICAIVAPEIAEMKEPFPMVVLAFTSLGCALACTLVNALQKKRAYKKEI